MKVKKIMNMIRKPLGHKGIACKLIYEQSEGKNLA